MRSAGKAAGYALRVRVLQDGRMRHHLRVRLTRAVTWSQPCIDATAAPPYARRLMAYTLIAEKPEHAAAIERVLDRAFGPGRHAKTSERVRERGARFEPALSRVALNDAGEVIGVCRIWRVEAGVAAVLPRARSRSIPPRKPRGSASRMTRDGVTACRSVGGAGIVLVGAERFFRPLGFTVVPSGRITLPGPVDPARLLWLELRPGGLDRVQGELRAPIALAPPRRRRFARERVLHRPVFGRRRCRAASCRNTCTSTPPLVPAALPLQGERLTYGPRPIMRDTLSASGDSGHLVSPSSSPPLSMQPMQLAALGRPAARTRRWCGRRRSRAACRAASGVSISTSVRMSLVENVPSSFMVRTSSVWLTMVIGTPRERRYSSGPPPVWRQRPTTQRSMARDTRQPVQRLRASRLRA